MEKIINELINCSIKGVDVYRYNNATWLIFTNEMRWVVELTDEGTLWYNYRFFNNIMRYVSMDPKEYEGYITQWANDYFFKDVNGVRGLNSDGKFNVRNIMNHGVKKMGDSDSIRVQNRADNLAGRIVKDVKPNIMDLFGNDNYFYDHDCDANKTEIWKIVEEGIKNTYPDIIPGDYDWSDDFNAKKVMWLGDKA